MFSRARHPNWMFSYLFSYIDFLFKRYWNWFSPCLHFNWVVIKVTCSGFVLMRCICLASFVGKWSSQDLGGLRVKYEAVPIGESCFFIEGKLPRPLTIKGEHFQSIVSHEENFCSFYNGALSYLDKTPKSSSFHLFCQVLMEFLCNDSEQRI